MTKNDNENNTAYGISALTPTNSVNISQSDITYNPTTPIWTNGILNRIEKLQEMTNDSSLFGDCNIFGQTIVNDISISSSYGASGDTSVGTEQLLSAPIEMCTLYQVVDKVLPFAPYVYRNYCVEVEMIEW